MLMRRIVTAVLCAAALPLALAACGDDGEKEPGFLDVSETPLSLENGTRGLYVHAMQSQYSNAEVFERDTDFANAVVLHAQVFSEYEQTQSASTSAPRFDGRIEDMYDSSLGDLVRGADTTVFVLDLLRLDRQWLTDWRGLDRDSPDVREQVFSFQARADAEGGDYQEDVVEYVLDALSVQVPTHLVIGADMEQYYLANPGDWPYFAAFVRQLRDAVRAEFPDVKIGVGINWSAFVDEVAPTFLAELERSSVDFVTVEAAWETVLDPLYYDMENEATRLDFFAFSSVPDPATYGDDPNALPEWHYAGIPTMFDEEPARTLPVAWYSIGWPVTVASPAQPGAFLQRFLNDNGGYDVDLVAWWGYNHLNEGECTKMQSDVGAPQNACFRGMYPTIPQLSRENPLTSPFFGR